jgi:hypothetical protein
MYNPFKQTTAGILSLFSTLVKSLEALAKREEAKALKLGDRATKLREKQRAALAERDAAEAAALNIKTLIGGAA